MREAEMQLSVLLFTSNRTYGGDGEIKILAEDIARNGLINPITIKHSPGKAGYDVVAGRRRVMAVQLLGWDSISCRILEGDEEERSDEIAGSENINRLGMHPLDEAAVFAKLLENGRPIEELAKQYDRSVSAIHQRVQLLSLNDDVKTMFRNGSLSLHSAAMLKGLSDKAQEAFCKHFKNHWGVQRGDEIDEYQVREFLSSLGYDHLYQFVKDKQCSECKTRTYFDDKNLFPELNDISDSCLDHNCYVAKRNQAIGKGIKSVKGEHKTHAEASLIIPSGNSDEWEKFLGSKVTFDGIEYKVLPWRWNTEAKAKDKGAVPCFEIRIKGSGKLEVTPGYWKEPEKWNSGANESPASKKKAFNPVVEILNLPKAEAEETLDALSNSKRLVPGNFENNVRDAVFWRVMEIKAQEWKDPKKTDSVSKEPFLKKHLHYLHGDGKKIFEMFVGKMTIADIAKLPHEKVFNLLCAMEFTCFEFDDPVKFKKGNKCDALKWAGLPEDTLKKLYQEEISKRIPKKKPEKKAEVKKDAKPKTSGAEDTTAGKKTEKKKKPLPAPEQMKKNKAKADKAKK